ncbi:MAG: hypothetical protein K0A94_11960 [Desulfuromonadales bacterium]|nr:hypothetical protein [Desulfuromonadales bacterium]
MSRAAIVSRWVIHALLLAPSMATNTLATGSKGSAQGQQRIVTRYFMICRV